MMSRSFSPLLGGVLFCAAFSLYCLAQGTGLAPDPLKQALEQADQAMRDRDYGAAARAYARVKADFAGTEGSHRAAYMRLRAFYFDKRYRDVLSEGAAYLRDAPEGSFADKVRYLMANAYQRTRGWGDASRLLQERAEFLAGDGYRERLSKLFLEQADSAFEGEEKKDEFGRPARKPDYPLALDLYKRARAIRVPPERAAEVDFRMAECLAQTDAGALAAPAYAQLLKDHPDSDLHAESLLRAGRHYMEWDPKTARELLDRVRKEFPDTPQAPLALLALADGLTNEPGKVRDEGLQLYRIFLERHPDHEQAPHAAFRRAEVLQRDREYAQAEPRWRDFLRRFPEHDKAPQARIQLAGGLLAVHRYDDAIAAWHAYLTAHPNDPNWEQARQAIPATFLSKAGHLLDKKEYGAAVEVYRAFLKEYPDHGQAAAVHLAIADAFDKAKNAESKLAMLDVCAQKYRGRREAAQALFATARHHDEHGDLTKAIEGYEKTAKEYAKFPEGRQARIILDTLRQKTLTIRAERIFSTTEAANLEVETRNIPKLQTRLYRVDLAEYFRKKKQVTGIENLAVDVVKPDLDGVIDLGERYERFRLFSGAHKLPVKQGEPGAYVVVVGEDDLTATTLIVVSDLRLVVKSSRGHLFCWAFRASDHAPWPGVRIAAAAGGQILEAKTGPDGTASIAHAKLGSGAQVMAEADGHYAFSNGAVGATAASGYKPVGYVFTDRPLYRPGETVKIGAFLRHTSKGVYTIPKNHEVELWVTDKNSVELVRRKLHTDDFGVLETEVVLDGEAPLGKARVHIRDGKRTFTGEFSIAEFRKPEFTVQLEADTLALRPGETIKVRAAARYLVGGPVSKAPLQWRLVRLPFAFDRSRYDSFAWFFESKRSKRDRAPSGAEVVERGTLTAGEDGTAQIEVETDEEAGDAVYVFELEATDVDRLSASARLDFFATRQDHFAVVDIDRKAVRPGEDFRVRVRTVDASHRPVSRSGKLIVARRELDARNSWTFVPVRTLEVSTSREGRAELSVQLPQGGRYEIRYESGALGPRRVTASAAMTATGEDFQKERDVRVVVDRRYYLEGEKARIFIDSPITGTPALLTFEAGRVLRHEFVQLKNSATVLEIPLTELYAPNVFVSIAVPGAHELKTASDEIVVFRYLDVRVRPQAPTGGPGEEVRFDIETVDALGRPVAASVALSLVDEALYMLENDPARGIRKRYYDVRRTHVVQTHSSFGFKYAGFTRPTNKDLLAEVQRKTGGPSAEDRAKEHVRAAVERLRKGDRDQAVVALGEALRHDPNSLEARELLDSLSAMGKATKLEATMERRRNMEKKVRRASLNSEYSKDKYADDDMVADEEEMDAGPSNNSAIGIGGGAGGGRGGRFKRPQGGVPPGMREPSDPAAFDSRNINLWPSKYTPPAPVLADARLAGAILMLFDQGGAGAVPPPLHVRADFRDTAFFKAVGLRTDASGKATVTVKMPENLTRWRAVARGISATTLVGETEASFVTRKDLLVRLSKPRFLTDRDTAESTGAVYNTTKQDMEVTSTLSAEGLTVAGGAERKPVQVEAGRLLAQRWTFEKPQPGRAKLTLEARAGRYGDAAESSLPVLAYGIPYRDGWAGSVEQSAVIPVDLPDTAIDGATRLFVSIAPSVDATVVDAVTWLEAFPYGCVEQTVNRFLPALMAERALRRMRSPDAARLNRIREVVEAGLRRLQRAQNPDGSFGWWPGDRAGDPYITALALWGMAEANRGGYRLPGNLLNGVTQALQRMSPALDDEARCFVQCALAVAGRAQLDALNRLYRNRFGLSAGAKALLCIAHDRAGRRFQADELRTLLAQDAVRDADGLHLSGRKDGRWLFGDVEATAYGLMAFLGEKPLSDDAHASVRWLLRHREGFSFGTTKQTGPAALALTAYLRVRGAQHNTGTVTLTVGGDEVGSLEVRDGKLEGRGFAVPTERLKKGRNVLEISVTGGLQVFYAARLQAVLRTDKAIPAKGKLIQVDRRYRPIEPQKGKTGYSVVHPDHRPKDELLPSLAEVRPGERMTVQLRITCREPQSYVMIEDPLPAGCEVLEGHETGNFARKERRDTRVVFFASRLPAGTTVFTYRIQAIFPGEYAVLPATAGPMYRPATYGRSAGGTLAVTRGRRDVQEHALPTPDELWLRAQELIREKKWADARVVLEDLRSSYKLRDAIEEELYVRLLRIDLETGRAEGVVAAYEELRARNSQRLTAFAGMSDQLRIGQAYQTQKQPRLAIGLFMNVVGLSYSTERQLAQTYRRIGDPARSLEQLIGAGLRYPDDGPVSNDLYGAAEEYRKLRRPAGGLMLAESLGLLRAYTALYPAAHNVDVAAFRTIELLTSLRRHDRAVVQATHFERRYPRSRYLDDAITFLMKAHFARREFPKASEAATLLLSRDFPTDRDPRRQAKSPFRPAAHHVLGKIAHAEGKLEEAVRQYRSGRSVPDASEALAFLEERTLEVEPLARARLAARPELLLTVKNVTGLQARIYPVDLFVLLAVRPSLTDLHKVDLTGIAPVATQKIPLQNVRPYRSAERRVQLELGGQGEPGAFLVTLKAGALERSTVFLLSDLHLELQRAGGKLRVYATVPGPGGALPAKDVFVKVSDGSRVRASGKTDVRGVFEAGGIGKTAAVVAERDGHYAIARLGPG